MLLYLICSCCIAAARASTTHMQLLLIQHAVSPGWHVADVGICMACLVIMDEKCSGASWFSVY